MEKEFVPYQPSLDMRELGFDELCLALYVSLLDGSGEFELIKLEKQKDKLISAPLYQQAFRWFREKYDVSSYVDYYENDDYEKIWYFIIKTKDRESQFDGSEETEYCNEPYFKTPEQAQLECLKKLIEIVKNGDQTSKD